MSIPLERNHGLCLFSILFPDKALLTIRHRSPILGGKNVTFQSENDYSHKWSTWQGGGLRHKPAAFPVCWAVQQKWCGGRGPFSDWADWWGGESERCASAQCVSPSCPPQPFDHQHSCTCTPQTETTSTIKEKRNNSPIFHHFWFVLLCGSQVS